MAYQECVSAAISTCREDLLACTPGQGGTTFLTTTELLVIFHWLTHNMNNYV